jgi:phosphoribosylformylglycinamidine synthase
MTTNGTVKALILTGYGLNCEAETAHAFHLAGAKPEQVHLADLLAGHRNLREYHILAFIGGFSFGDHLGAGTVFATRLKYRMKEDLEAFVSAGKLVVGICNGFQTMVKLGLLPGFSDQPFERLITLTWNHEGVFRDAWVTVRANPKSPCVFTRGLDRMDLPVRHGEGRFVARDEEVLAQILDRELVALAYVDKDTGEPTETFPHNPNGSPQGIAGITDPTGRIFGLMPHPEACLFPWNHPDWTRKRRLGNLPKEGGGVQIFRNAVDFARKNLLG